MRRRFGIAGIAVLILTSGCQKPYPHTNAADVCRASPGWAFRAVIADDLTVNTGVINGVDGVTETAYLCRTPFYPETLALDSCTAFDTNGMTADGAVVTFVPLGIRVQLARAAGYLSVKVRVDETCHG